MIEKKFSYNIDKIFAGKTLPKIAIAVSGGIDSMALLSLCQKILAKKSQIYCLTVNHNVRENSDLDANFVANFCQKNAIKCHILQSYLENPPEVDIENSLREMRYNLLTNFCKKNQITTLLTGHHRQDLAENFLIRLFRGSGIDGLAAINTQTNLKNINIIRPLLDFSKSELENYLRENQIKWIEDESNNNEKFLRNKIRKFLEDLPDYEAINNRIANTAQSILEAKNILERETKKQYPQIVTKNNNSLILDIDKFQKLEKSTATRYLALALMEVSQRIYKPRLKKLERVYFLLMENKLLKEEFYGCILEKISIQTISISPK